MKAYKTFARFYDELTQNVAYDKRADYLCDLARKFDHDFGLCLDLACGTGTLTVELANKGVDIFGVDASEEMMTEALAKAHDAKLDILFLRQKMQELDLYGTIDTCICMLDSINHLTSLKHVEKAFCRVSLFMNKGGLFIFDVNSIYKTLEVLGGNTFVIEAENVYCVWQNKPVGERSVHIDLDFFEREGDIYRRYTESFVEKAYSHDEIVHLLHAAGFELCAHYGNMSFSEPDEKEERIVYIARKI